MKNIPTYRIWAVWVVLLAIFSPMLFSLQFHAERMVHRMYRWHEANHENLETLELDSSSICWAKKGKELWISGKYFDVVSIKYHTGKAIIKGFFDHKETEMHHAFRTATNRNKDSHLATQKLIHWLQTNWLSDWIEMSFTLNLLYTKPGTGFKDPNLRDCKLSIPHLPPWHTI